MGFNSIIMANANNVKSNANVNNNAPESTVTNSAVKQVNIESLVGALKNGGEAKLSDHGTVVVSAPSQNPAPEQPKKKDATKTNGSKKGKKEDAQTAEPLTAQIAKQRIEDAIKGGSVIGTADAGSSRMTFKDATDARRCYELRRCFRKLGGEFDREKQMWSVPSSYWAMPETAVESKSEARQEYEKKLAEKAAELGGTPKTDMEEIRRKAMAMAKELNSSLSDSLIQMIVDKYFAA